MIITTLTWNMLPLNNKIGIFLFSYWRSKSNHCHHFESADLSTLWLTSVSYGSIRMYLYVLQNTFEYYCSWDRHLFTEEREHRMHLIEQELL